MEDTNMERVEKFLKEKKHNMDFSPPNYIIYIII